MMLQLDGAFVICSFSSPLKVKWPGVTQVVTFGGSYPGALSAWIRLRLPHLVSAAFSTSSPVEAVIDFTGMCIYSLW